MSTTPHSPGKPIDVEALQEQARVLSQIAASTGFLEMLKEIQETDESQRLSQAERLARVEALQERGVYIPQDFRLTTRYFENSGSKLGGIVRIDEGEESPVAARATVCASVGYIVCASVGGEVEV